MRSESTRVRERAGSASALLALAALVLMPPGGLTLCLGHYGHVGFEVAGGSAAAPPRGAEEPHCPCDARSPAEPSTLAPDSSPPAHEPCDDLPLAGTGATALPRPGDGAGESAEICGQHPCHSESTIDPAHDTSSVAPISRATRPPDGRHALAIAPALSSRRLV